MNSYIYLRLYLFEIVKLSHELDVCQASLWMRWLSSLLMN